MSIDPRAALRTALSPKSIAVIGASDNTNKIGGRPIAYLSRFGFRGKVFPINPMRNEVQGFRSFSAFQDLPEIPDVVIIAVPGELAVQSVQECAQAGVSLSIVMSSGFGESHPEGKLQEQKMKASARACGMRIVGPNSQGLANFGTGAVASFSTMFTEVQPKDGPIGIISQSGAMSVIPYGLLRARGLGIRHSHATGNDCDVTVCELATVVAEDDGLKLLMLYLEGIPDPWNLAEAARIARDRNLPLVVLKSGRTAAGQDAAQSHTGALANEDRVVDAFLKEHGIMRAESMVDLIDTAPLYMQGWKPNGRRLVAISNSGAVCVMTADAATQEGMPLEPLLPSTQQELKSILPGFATVKNPVDITAALLSNSGLFGAILPPISKDPAADAFLIGIAVAGAGYDVEKFSEDASNFADETGKPLVIAAPQPNIADQFKANGLVVYPTEGEAVHALSLYLTHAKLMADTKLRSPSIRKTPFYVQDTKLLDEASSLDLLAQYGIPAVRHRLCLSEKEAIEAFTNLRVSAVVAKGCTGDISHKTELGLVYIGIRDADSLRIAFNEIHAAAKSANIELKGVIVAECVRGMRELMIGARVDPVFGPIVLVGDGGKYVEAMPDLQVLIPPFSQQDAVEALYRLRIAPLLDGVRGDLPLDVNAFCQAAVAVGCLMVDEKLGINQLDINPIMVGSLGQGCTALDAVIYQKEIE